MPPAATSHPRLNRGLEWLRGAAASGYVQSALIAALALALRLHGLADQPFWLDEVTSLRRATGSLHDLVLDALRNHHYPSYFLLLSLVARLGVSEWLLRLPSAIFGALAAALAAAIGRDIGGKPGGAVAGLLLALSPLEVQLGQEARSYTLVGCLILVALWGLVGLARWPAIAARPAWRRDGLHGRWLAYCLGTAAALSVLGVAVPWWIAANLGAVAIACAAGTARRPFLRQWLLAQAVVLVLWAPSLLPLLLAGKGGAATGWAPSPTWQAVWATLAPVYLLRVSNFLTLTLAPAAVPGLSLIVGGLAALGVWRLRHDPPVLGVLAAPALFPPVAVLLLAPFVPMLVPRYLAWSAAPFFVLAAAGLGAAARFHRAAAALLAVLCLVNLAPSYGFETKPRWDLAAARLAAAAHPGDVVLADRGYTYQVFSLYAARSGLAAHGITLSRDPSEAARLAAGHELWALFGRIGQKAIGPPEAYLRTLAPLGAPVASYDVGRYITIYRFRVPARPAAAPPSATKALTVAAPKPKAGLP